MIYKPKRKGFLPTQVLAARVKKLISATKESKNDVSLQISKYYLDFGTKDKKCALNKPITDKIKIVNTGNSAVKIKFPESQSKPHVYNLTITPHDFKLKKGASIDITVEISVSCTTRLKEIITMQVQGGLSHFFSLRVDSVMSQILDYSELNIGSVIGSGGFGTVYKATWRGLPVAVKKMTEVGDGFDQEVEVHRELAHHPNVVHFVGICVSPQVTVCEYIEGGSLDKYLNATPKLGMRIRLKIALEIAKGMTFLHENELLHLDLKPPNFLVVSLSQSAPVAIKLADFGLSQGSSQTFKGRKVEGSFLYMAPEVFMNAQFSRAADVWSYGACLIEILTDRKPFYEYEKLPYIQMVKKRDNCEVPQVPPNCHPELAELITSCLYVEKAKRPTFEQIVQILENFILNHHDYLGELESPRPIVRPRPQPSISVTSLLSQDILNTPTPSEPLPLSPRALPTVPPLPLSPRALPSIPPLSPRSFNSPTPSAPLSPRSTNNPAPLSPRSVNNPAPLSPRSMNNPAPFAPLSPRSFPTAVPSPPLPLSPRSNSESPSSSGSSSPHDTPPGTPCIPPSTTFGSGPPPVPPRTTPPSSYIVYPNTPPNTTHPPSSTPPPIPVRNSYAISSSPTTPPNSLPSGTTPPPVPPRTMSSRSIRIPTSPQNTNVKNPFTNGSPSTPTSPSFYNTPQSPTHATLAKPSNNQSTSPASPVSRTRHALSRSTSPSGMSSSYITASNPLSASPAAPLSTSSPTLPHHHPLRKHATTTSIAPNTHPEYSEDSRKYNPLLKGNGLMRTMTEPQLLKPLNSAPSEQLDPSLASAEMDDPKIESLRHLTQTNFNTAVSTLEQVSRSLQVVYSLKAAIELSKQILAYKRALESASETFLMANWDTVNKFVAKIPRPTASQFVYTPPPPSHFSSSESYTHVSALLTKTGIVLGQALDVMHYLQTRLASPADVAEILTLAKCARWIKNNAHMELSEDTLGRLRAGLGDRAPTLKPLVAASGSRFL